MTAPAPAVPQSAYTPTPSSPAFAAPREPAPPPAVARRHKRLVSRLDELNVRLRVLEQHGPAAHLAAARLYWREAHGMLARGDADAAWYALNGANRALVAVATEHELDDHATILAAEAGQKLASWRRATVLALLAARDGCDLAERRRRVALAMQVRDDHSVDRFYKINLMRRQLASLGAILALALAAAVAAMWALGVSFETPARDPRLAGGPLLGLVALFGAVGGAFSATVGVARANVDGRIPQQVVAGIGAVLRPLLGAAGAVAFYAFLRAGLGVQPSTDALGAYAFWAFAAGFSERLLARTVDSAADRVGGGDAPAKG